MTTEIVDDRELAKTIGYWATDWSPPMSYEDYENFVKDWQLTVLIRDGEPIGTVFRKDGETHVSILPHWRKRWASRGLLKRIMADTRFTRVDVGYDFMYGVLERLGFQRQPDGTLTLVKET